MQPSAKIRVVLASVFAIGTTLHAQPLPPAQPTQPVQRPLTAAQQPPQHAQVTFTDGQLSVSANNSSLNQILRDIARETKMKITGGVTDERVFGQYGPGTPSRVLSTLLDGTGSNMLYLQAAGASPGELILTPRQGGPTPPNPNAGEPPEEEAPTSEASRPINAPVQPRYRPQTNMPQNSTPADPSPQSSPNDVKTPQQIYEQLQHMRQQQQQQSNPQ